MLYYLFCHHRCIAFVNVHSAWLDFFETCWTLSCQTHFIVWEVLCRFLCCSLKTSHVFQIRLRLLTASLLACLFTCISDTSSRSPSRTSCYCLLSDRCFSTAITRNNNKRYRWFVSKAVWGRSSNTNLLHVIITDGDYWKVHTLLFLYHCVILINLHLLLSADAVTKYTNNTWTSSFCYLIFHYIGIVTFNCLLWVCPFV